MTGGSPFTLVIGGDASVKTAEVLASSLKDALDAHSAVQVDTQTLSAADVTTVQTLLAGLSKARAEGKTLAMLTPLGAPLLEVLQAGGLMGQEPTAGFWGAQPFQTSGTMAI